MNWNKIIKGCKAGKRKSQAALYEHTSDDMMNICVRYLGNSQDARDVMQDVYLRAFQKIESFDSSKGTIGAWLAKVTVNECLTLLRKRKRINLFEVVKPVLQVATEEDVISDLSAQEIFHEIERMPDGYRVIFNLYVVEGYDHNEIGELLGIAAASSRSQLARAKNFLRKVITQKSNPKSYEKAE